MPRVTARVLALLAEFLGAMRLRVDTASGKRFASAQTATFSFLTPFVHFCRVVEISAWLAIGLALRYVATPRTTMTDDPVEQEILCTSSSIVSRALPAVSPRFLKC